MAAMQIAAAGPGRHDLTLVVVDDDPAVLDVVGRFAARAGFQPVACAGGMEGLSYFARRRADVAVVDLRMPDVDGIEVARAIRAADEACPIILISGAATIDSAIEAGKLGVRDYLTKPLDFARFEALLASIRGQAAGRHDESLASMERRRIEEVLHRTDGNKAAAAKILGLSRRALYRRLERYGIKAN